MERSQCPWGLGPPPDGCRAAWGPDTAGRRLNPGQGPVQICPRTPQAPRPRDLVPLGRAAPDSILQHLVGLGYSLASGSSAGSGADCLPQISATLSHCGASVSASPPKPPAPSPLTGCDDSSPSTQQAGTAGGDCPKHSAPKGSASVPVLIHAARAESGLPPGAAKPTSGSLSAPPHHPPTGSSQPRRAEPSSRHGGSQCHLPKAQGGLHSCHRFFLPGMRRVLKTPTSAPALTCTTSHLQRDCPAPQPCPVSRCHAITPSVTGGSELSMWMHRLPRRSRAGKQGRGRAPRAEPSLPTPHVSATPFGGPGEDSGVEQSIGHIVGGEDDDIAFGVPIAEHSPVIVRPGKRGRQKRPRSRLGVSGATLRPSPASEALLHLGSEGRSHTTFQP